MKITMYELITLIKNKKAPKKIKIDEDILNLEIGKETLYRFEKRCCSLNFGYYIDNNKLDNEVEIIEEEKKIPEKLGLIKYSEDPATSLIHHKVDEIIDYLKSKGE